MSTPIAQGAALHGGDLCAECSAEAPYASEDGVTPALSPPLDDEATAPDAGHRPTANDDEAMEAALAEFNDAVRVAIDLAAPVDETEADEAVAERPAAENADPWQDTWQDTWQGTWQDSRQDPWQDGGGDAVAPFAEEECCPVEDALFAMPRFLRLDSEGAAGPAGEERRSARYFLIRYASMVGCAAVVAYGLISVPIPQSLTSLDLPGRLADSVDAVIAQVKTAEFKTAEFKTGTIPAARLFVKDQQALANEPLPIEISVQNAVQNTSLRLDGLAAGTRLSAGSPVGVSSWQFPLRDLQSLYLYAPAGFVGVMNSGVDLFGPDRRLIDRRDVRFEWLAVKKNQPPPAAAALTEPKPPIERPRISADLADTWMARGQGFLNAGDIGAARILFERLANAGIADGAFALAKTYDTRYLISHHVIGLAGDDAKAQALYRRAMQMGSAEAGRMVEQATRN